MKILRTRKVGLSIAALIFTVLVGAGFDSCGTAAPKSLYRESATAADRMSRTLNSAVRATYAAEKSGIVSKERVQALDPIYKDAAYYLKAFIDFGKGFNETTFTDAVRKEALEKFGEVTKQLDKIDASDLPENVKSDLDSLGKARKKIEKALNQEVKR